MKNNKNEQLLFENKYIIIKDLTKDSFTINNSDNTFIVFNSIDDIFFLIYANDYNSIISYNLLNNIKINEIKNAHDYNIINFRHFLDKTLKRDLIISISGNDNNIKLWNFNNYECLLNLKNVNNNGYLFSACFFNYNNQNYIISSNLTNLDNVDPIKIFDFNGKIVKNIDDYDSGTIFIDTFYDNKTYKNYIITSNIGYIKSYDYNKNQIYKKYCDNDEGFHYNILINNKQEVVKMIESSEDGNIRIWDFHLGLLIDKIKVSNNGINGFCLSNDNGYLYVGCDDKQIKIINLNNGHIVRSLSGHNKRVLTVKKIILPNYGECLISQGEYNDQIKLWIKNNYDKI